MTIGQETSAVEKPHLSATQLEMYWRCPESYRRRYIEGGRIPPGVALLLGSAIHSGAELNFSQKIATHDDLPVNEIIDAAVAAFDEKVKDGYVLSDDEQSRGAAAVLWDAKDQTASLARVHAEQQAPDYQPVAVEHATRLILPNATHDVLTITDLRDDQDRVVDLKTGARKKPQSEVDGSTQLTLYAAAFQREVGKPPSEVRLDVLVKTKKPGRQVLTSTRTRGDFAAMANRINATLHAINSGSFPPASPGAWQCSPRWCGFWSLCPYVNSERRAAAEGSE